MTDAELAAHLAATAGRILLEIRASGVFSPKALGQAGDQTANQFLVAAIREARPDDGLLSEEMKCDGTRLTKSRVWIIDPVDGTREYGEARSDWAVHVGLAIDARQQLGQLRCRDWTQGACCVAIKSNRSPRNGSATHGSIAYPPCRRSFGRREGPRRGTCAHGVGRRKGDGCRSR